MIGRIVEIAGESRFLSKDRGFLVIAHQGKEQGRIPLDDVAALICNAHGLVYTNNLLVALAERGCPVVLCGKNHLPVGIVCSVENHHIQGARIDTQISVSLPQRKRLWQQVVRAKLGMQAATLGAFGLPQAPLRALIPKVRSGDPGNMEGVGARRYWTLLFGPDFRRDPTIEGTNALLNYGYTVLRSSVARHLLATGLYPGIALHHSNDSNSLRLVDDLMEPFRPLIDAQVRVLVDTGRYAVDAATKRELALTLTRGLPTRYGVSPLTNVIERTCRSLAQAYEGTRVALELPPDHPDNVLAWLRDGDLCADEASDADEEALPAQGPES